MPLAMTASERSRDVARGALEQRLRSAHARTARFEAVLQRRRMFFVKGRLTHGAAESRSWSEESRAQLAASSLQGICPAWLSPSTEPGLLETKVAVETSVTFSFDSKSARCLGNKKMRKGLPICGLDCACNDALGEDAACGFRLGKTICAIGVRLVRSVL